MRRRLLLLTVGAAAVLLAALVVPLLAAYAEQRAVSLHEQRLAAATRFAALVDDDGDLGSLASDLVRYGEVTGTRVWVVDPGEQVRAASSADPVPPTAAPAVADALDGSTTGPPDPLWPWRDDDLVVATPVGRDAQVLGAVVLTQDTGGVRVEVAGWMAVGALASAVVLGLLAWLVAIPLVGWIVRPVADLEDSVHVLAEGGSARARIEGPPELRRLAESFNDMSARVERSQRQQRDLVADVSHQLANPLTAVRLRLEELDGSEPEFDEAVGAVLAETDRMARALEAMIEVSRAGAADRARVPLDVAARVAARVELWQPLFGDLLVLVDEVGHAPAVLEEDLVETVVDALLDNAAKYAPGERVDVRLEARADGWLLTVRDHGAGVDAEEAALLGRRFQRLDRHADVDGTGLGLAIVAARVEDVGGGVEVAPAGPGTAVTVTLPAGPPRGTSAALPGAGPAAG